MRRNPRVGRRDWLPKDGQLVIVARRAMADDYYHILEVRRDASQEDIPRAHLRIVLRLHTDKNPHSKEVAAARFKVVSEAYEVLSNEKKRRQYDHFGSSAFSAQPAADAISSMSGGAYAFTFREPDEVFREFSGAAGSPCQEMFGKPDRKAKPAGGSTVMTSRLPFWQQSFSTSQRPRFRFNADDLLFASQVPGGMGSAPGFTGTPTQQMYSAWYEGAKRIETRTLIEVSAKTVLRFEDGVPVSRTVNGDVQPLYEASEDARCRVVIPGRNSDDGLFPASTPDTINTVRRHSQFNMSRPAQPQTQTTAGAVASQ